MKTTIWKDGAARGSALVALVLAGSLAGSCAVRPAAPPATTRAATAPGPADPAAAVAEFTRLAAEARAEAGCRGSLAWRDDVAAVAAAHSEEMYRLGYFDHVDRRGHTPMERVRAAGIPVRAVAENIAQGHPTGEAVLRAWLASPGHRRNLLDCGYTHHGVGLVGGYWTHVLVRLAPQ